MDVLLIGLQLVCADFYSLYNLVCNIRIEGEGYGCKQSSILKF